MTIVDSHCHLDDEQFNDDREAVIDRALASGIKWMLSIGTGEGPPDLEAAIRLADKHEPVYCTVGVHPQYAEKAQDEHLKSIEQLLRHPKCVALGEIGLDYHWQPYDKEKQTAVFTEQLSIAAAAGKPIIIHTREAWSDTVEILRTKWAPTGLPCILHCFTGGPPELDQALELGCYISFAGVVTYPKATAVHEAAKLVPPHLLLVETDAPYLPPVPFRGKRNEPAHVIHTLNRVAALRNQDPSEVAENVLTNFRRLLGTTHQLH